MTSALRAPHRSSCLLAAAIGLYASRSALAEEAPSFSPGDHLPAPVLLYARVASMRQLRERLAETLPGRVAAHPDCRRACRGLRERVARIVRRRAACIRPLPDDLLGEFLERFRGEAALAIYRAVMPGEVEWVLALQLEETALGSAAIPDDLRSWFGKITGGDLAPSLTGELEAHSSTGPGRQILVARIENYCLVTTSPDLLGGIHESWLRGSREGPIAGSSLRAELRDALDLSEEGLRLEVDLQQVREWWLDGLATESQKESAGRLLSFSGAEALTSAGFVLGFPGGQAELRMRIGARDGFRGLLGVGKVGFLAVEFDDSVATLVPGDCIDLAALRIAPGPALRELDRHLRDRIPEIGAQLDLLYNWALKSTGVSVADDLWALGDITWYRYRAMPGAGGLFADCVWLARSDQVAPYWQLTVELAGLLGAELERIEVAGRTVEHLRIPDELAAQLLDAWCLPPDRSSESAEHLARSLLGRWLLTSFLGLACVEGEEGWTALSSQPLHLRRFLERQEPAARLADDEEGRAHARAILGGSTAAMLSRRPSSMLWWYNSLSAAGGVVPLLMRRWGIETVHLPPAEVFGEAPAGGSIELRCDARGATLRLHRPSSLAGALPSSLGWVLVLGGLALPEEFFEPATQRQPPPEVKN